MHNGLPDPITWWFSSIEGSCTYVVSKRLLCIHLSHPSSDPGFTLAVGTHWRPGLLPYKRPRKSDWKSVPPYHRLSIMLCTQLYQAQDCNSSSQLGDHTCITYYGITFPYVSLIT